MDPLRYASSAFIISQNKKIPKGGFPPPLFFHFLMHGVFFTPFAIFFELDFSFDKLLVFPAPVVDALALVARELDQLFLCHAPFYTIHS